MQGQCLPVQKKKVLLLVSVMNADISNYFIHYLENKNISCPFLGGEGDFVVFAHVSHGLFECGHLLYDSNTTRQLKFPILKKSK